MKLKKLEQNPEQVDEKFMKMFLKSIPASYNDHPKCLEIEELIENSRNGLNMQYEFKLILFIK